MFQRFTEQARKAVVHAQEEVRVLRHDALGTEHILLGLLSERGDPAALALNRLGIDLDGARAEVARIVTADGSNATAGVLPFTANAKKGLECALREAQRLRHRYIGTEHLLLGVLDVEGATAITVLDNAGVRAAAARAETFETLGLPAVPGFAPEPADAPRLLSEALNRAALRRRPPGDSRAEVAATESTILLACMNGHRVPASAAAIETARESSTTYLRYACPVDGALIAYTEWDDEGRSGWGMGDGCDGRRSGVLNADGGLIDVGTFIHGPDDVM